MLGHSLTNRLDKHRLTLTRRSAPPIVEAGRVAQARTTGFAVIAGTSGIHPTATQSSGPPVGCLPWSTPKVCWSSLPGSTGFTTRPHRWETRWVLRQGSVMTSEEQEKFLAHPAAADAVTLRRADEAAKIVGHQVPGLDVWAPRLLTYTSGV